MQLQLTAKVSFEMDCGSSACSSKQANGKQTNTELLPNQLDALHPD